MIVTDFIKRSLDNKEQREEEAKDVRALHRMGMSVEDIRKAMGYKKYEPRQIETEPLTREVLTHGYMHYRCDFCGKLYQMWLEKGLEDHLQGGSLGENHKPVPYCIACPCGGNVIHVEWRDDLKLDSYVVLSDRACYFENVDGDNCGVPHFREGGGTDPVRGAWSMCDGKDGLYLSDEIDSISKAIDKMFSDGALKTMMESVEENYFGKRPEAAHYDEGILKERCGFDGDALTVERLETPIASGLEMYSLTQLKAEIRRRRREKGGNPYEKKPKYF